MWSPRARPVFLYLVTNLYYLHESFIAAHDPQEACRFLQWAYSDCSVLQARAWNGLY